MSATSTQSNTTFIDLEVDLLPLLGSITKLPVDPPSLYLGLEGTNLGRHGSISILSLHIAPTKKTYLIDIHRLGMAAFSTTNNSGTSLKTILESSAIPKVVFDIRNDSDALFSLFGISVDGIRDLQLMELACRTGSHKFLSGLAICIEKESPSPAAAKTQWSRTEGRSRWLFVNNGRSKFLNERPLGLEITEYCEQGVMSLPGLYNVYNTKLRQPEQTFWRVHVRQTTKDRIKLSQSSGYDGKSNANALGWDDEAIEEEIESWNEDIMLEARNGESILNENDEWVPAPKDDLDFLFQ